MMMWSCTATPSGLAALTMSFVTAMSAFEGGGVARRMVVHQNERRRAQLQRALDHLAGI
jgi:hypothetical protein